jgi:pyridoxine kinase
MRILSIQSSVAYGHAGNSAATFPLQRLGHDVWPVLTVHFSNHTGYGAWRGEVFQPSVVADVVRGIAERGMLGRADAVLTGYQGSPGVAEVVLDTVMRVRALNPAAVYCCDPVMGDVGRGMFVQPGIPQLIRDRVVPAADVVTPNAFELAYLAGTGGDPETATPADISTEDGLLAAVDRLRATGPATVLVTSIEDGEEIAPEPGGSSGDGETGQHFGVTGDGGSPDGGDGAGDAADGGERSADAPDRPSGAPATISMIAVDGSGAYRVRTPRLPLQVNGAGDVTAALFLVHLLEHGIADALARTASSIFGVLAETARRVAGAEPGGGVEIALIPAQEAIAHPRCEFEVTRLR